MIIFGIFIVALVVVVLFIPTSPYVVEDGYYYFSCGMENSYRRELFIFKIKHNNKAELKAELINKINSQSTYGWYYDSVYGVKQISPERARELIKMGAMYI